MSHLYLEGKYRFARMSAPSCIIFALSIDKERVTLPGHF